MRPEYAPATSDSHWATSLKRPGRPKVTKNLDQQVSSGTPRCNDEHVQKARSPGSGDRVRNNPATGQPSEQRVTIGVEYVLRKRPTHSSELCLKRTAVCPLPGEGIDIFDRITAGCEQGLIGVEENSGMQKSHPQPRQTCCMPAGS